MSTKPDIQNFLNIKYFSTKKVLSAVSFYIKPDCFGVNLGSWNTLRTFSRSFGTVLKLYSIFNAPYPTKSKVLKKLFLSTTAKPVMKIFREIYYFSTKSALSCLVFHQTMLFWGQFGVVESGRIMRKKFLYVLRAVEHFNVHYPTKSNVLKRFCGQ